jgi:large subunit ribosomal protein L9
MQVILIQDVNNLGGANEVVTVKNGYARNFLIPQKFAVEASPSNLKQLEERLKQIKKKEDKMLAEINKVIAALKRGGAKHPILVAMQRCNTCRIIGDYSCLRIFKTEYALDHMPLY